MANNTIKFDIKAAVDTGGLDEFVSQLRQLKDVAEPADRVLGQAVKEIKAWAEGARISERNTTAATTAINALTSAMTAGGNEWKKGTQAANELNRSLRETVNAANAAKAALAAPARTTSGAGQQIADMRKGLQDLTIGSAQYLTLLQQITEKEALLGRRTGRAGVVAANQAFEGALLTRGYGAPDRLQQMPDTTAALRQRLSELAQEFPNVIRGSERYVQIATEMRTIESQLAKDLTGTTQALRQRSAATQAKIDAVRAYNEQAIRERVVNGELNIAERRRTNFGDVPQAMRTESGVFIAPPYRSGYSGFGTMYDRPIGPQTALDYFQSRANQFPAPIGPQTPLQYWQSRTTSGAMQGPAGPTDLFRSIGGIDTAGTTAKLQTMGRSYEQVAQQIRDTAQAAGGSTRALQAERQAWEQLQASVGPATREYKQAGREMQRLDRQLGTSTRGERFLESAGAISAGAFFGGPEGLVGGLVGMAIGGPGAALGGASIGAQLGIVRKGIGDMAVYSAELGKMRIALQGVVADNEQYAKSLEVVSNVSTQLNIPVQEATQGFTRLAAAVVGAGGNVGDAEVVFRGVSSAVKATGGNAQDAQSAMLALSQVFSKGKVSAEELQGQLGERLPGAVTLFAQATGRTLPQLAKDLEQGTVGLNDLMRFTELLSSKYAANALRIAKSTEDSGARQAVALANLREEFGKTFLPLGGMLQDGVSAWAEYATGAIKSINDIVGRYEFLRETLKVGGIGLMGLTPVVGPVLAGMMAGGRSDQSPQRRLAAAGSTTMYSDAQGNVYDAATGKLLLPSGRSQTSFADPKGSSDDKERIKREREEKQRLNEAAQRERLGLQLFNDEVRRQEQLAENRIRLEDRVFQYKQELMRRERDQQLQLDRLRQQILFTSLSPEGRAAAGPIQELLQRFQALAQDRQDIVDRLSVAEQALKSAQKNLDNVTRFSSAYQDAEQRSARPSDGDLQSSRPPGIGDQFLARILGGQYEDLASTFIGAPGSRASRGSFRNGLDAFRRAGASAFGVYRGNPNDVRLLQQFFSQNPAAANQYDLPVNFFLRYLSGAGAKQLAFSNAQGQALLKAIREAEAKYSDPQRVNEFLSTRNTASRRSLESRIKQGYLPIDYPELSKSGTLQDLSFSFGRFWARRNRDRSYSIEDTYDFNDLSPGARKSGEDWLDISPSGVANRLRRLGKPFNLNLRVLPSGQVEVNPSLGPQSNSAIGDQFTSILAMQNGFATVAARGALPIQQVSQLTQNQFDGASPVPLLKKFESVASLGYIPVSIENPDVIAQATGRIVQHLHGDPARPGYDRSGHGLESNAHDHFGFDSEATTRRVMQELRRRGYTVTRFGVRSGHTDGSLHYENRAFDVPWSQFGSGPIGPNDFARSRKLRAEVEEILGLKPGLTTTLPNGREIRTPGAAAAALRAAAATGQVDEARAAVKQVRAELALFDKDRQALSDLSIRLGIEQTVQSLRDQEVALRDNYAEWKVRNRLQLEGVKPEIIDFEVNKTKALEQQKRQLSDIDRLTQGLGPAFDAIGKGDAFRKFMEQSKSEIQQRTSGIIALQGEMALAAADPMLEWQAKMNDLNKSLEIFNNKQKLALTLSDQFTSNLAGGFSSAASSIISGNGSIQQSFADLFNNVAKMFIDTIARVLADQATQFLLRLLKPGFNQWTSLAPEGFSSFTSGITGGLGGFGGGSVIGNFVSGLPQLAPAGITGMVGAGFATGGISSGPTSGYPVTLHGTEAVVPLPNGRAIPVEMKGSGSTSVVVNVNMGTGEASVSSNERDGQLLGTALSDAVQAELIRQQRPGGILYRR